MCDRLSPHLLDIFVEISVGFQDFHPPLDNPFDQRERNPRSTRRLPTASKALAKSSFRSFLRRSIPGFRARLARRTGAPARCREIEAVLRQFDRLTDHELDDIGLKRIHLRTATTIVGRGSAPLPTPKFCYVDAAGRVPNCLKK